jgi:hypothetical protein
MNDSNVSHTTTDNSFGFNTEGCCFLPSSGHHQPFPLNAYSYTTNQHQTSKEKAELDKFLATKLNNVSLKDREEAFEEVHGIPTIKREDHDALMLGLHELDKHLTSIKRGTVYEQAELMDAAYVTHRHFRLMFLRGSRYNPTSAAEQLVRFFDAKLALFGTEKLVKNITLDDLDEYDKEWLQQGSLQVLPNCDRAGRQIVVNIKGLGRPRTLENELRAKFYLLMTLLESEEGQRKGFVGVLYVVGRYKDTNKGAGLAQQATLFHSLPIHISGIQFCCDDYSQYILMHTVMKIFSGRVLVKFRTHYGTHMECLYALRAFGIPEDSIPISSTDAEPLLGDHMAWYNRRKVLDMERDEETLSKPNCTPLPVMTPRPHDILFGLQNKCHPGNIRFHDFVSQNAEEYEAAAGRQEKTKFARKMIHHLKATGSRFLTFDCSSMEWIEVSDTEARNKLSKKIRNQRRTTAQEN